MSGSHSGGRVAPSHATAREILRELRKQFATERSAIRYFEDLRWGATPSCPTCASTKVYRTVARRRLPLWRCSPCSYQFTVTSGTVMQGSMLPLRKVLFAFHLIASDEGASSQYLAEALDITKRTAWHLGHRIRATMAGLASVQSDQDKQQRKLVDQHHHVSARHRERYTEELKFKQSMGDDRESAAVVAMRNMVGKRLTLADLGFFAGPGRP